MSLNRLNFNEILFRKQIKVFQLANILFTTVLIFLFVGSILIEADIDNKKMCIICNTKGEWKPQNVYGNLFYLSNQLMVLLQILVSWYVLVKLPQNDGIFEQNLVQVLNEEYPDISPTK